MLAYLILPITKVNAQNSFDCNVQTGTVSTSSVQSASCNNTLSNTNPDFVGKYRKVDFYVPHTNLPKIIKVAIHLFTGPTGSNTLQNDPSTIANLTQVVDWVNAMYQNNAPSSDPITGVPLYPSTNIQFELDSRIYFYGGTSLWNSSSVSSGLSYLHSNFPDRLEYLPIVLMGLSTVQNALPPYPHYISTAPFVAASFAADSYVHMGNGTQTFWYPFAQTLEHELGHCMDLLHTYDGNQNGIYGSGDACCPEIIDPNHPTDFLSDVFDINASNWCSAPGGLCYQQNGWGCDPYLPTNHCTNNAMGGSNYFSVNGIYWSPLQIAKMHRACYIKSVRKYVKDCPVSPTIFAINQDEIWDFDIRMYQNIEVNAGATLTIRCNVHMPEGAKIIVHDGAALILDGATLDGSCDGMWGGIEVEGNASISSLNGTLIQDAQYGVLVNDNAIMSLENTTFNRCFVGVFVPSATLSFNSIIGYIKGCTFKCDNTLHPPYAGQSPSPGVKTFAGIEMHDVAFNIDGGVARNTFQDLNIGIIGRRANYTVLNCYFQNIQPDFTYGNSVNGSGIYVVGGHGYQSLKQQGFGNSLTSDKSFENCRFGIFSTQMNNTISNNNMFNVGTGVRVQYGNYRSTVIAGNLIDCYAYGVYAAFNDAANNLIINGNYIYVGYNGGSAKAMGIYVNEFSLANNHTSIGDNHLHLNNARNGIYVRNVSNASIGYNTVDMINSAVNYYGISLQGCERNSVNCNGVTSVGLSGNTNQRGIFISSSTNSSIACNSVNNTYHGIRFDGICGGTSLSGNGINNHRNGLFCGTTSILDNQLNRGNTWNGTYLNFGALHAGNYQASLFYINPFSTPYLPPSISPASNWFYQGSGSPFSCSLSTVCNANIANPNNEDLVMRIAQGDIHTTDYTISMEYAAQRYLFEKLSNDNTLLNSNPDFQNFYNNSSQGNADELNGIRDGSNMLYNMTISLRDQIEQNRISIEQNLEQIKVNNQQLENGTLTENERAALIDVNLALEQTIRDLTVFNEAALFALENNRILNAEGLRVSNEGIITNANYESNERLVNEIYLQTIARNIFTFTVDQENILLSIASQCPYAGGLAVYKARGMYAMINDEIDYDDDALCLSEGVVLRQASNQSALSGVYEFASVYPNPANDMVTLSFEFGNDVSGIIDIFNSLGQNVSSSILSQDEHFTSLNVKSLENGIYTYSVRSNAGFIQKGKLVITR